MSNDLITRLGAIKLPTIAERGTRNEAMERIVALEAENARLRERNAELEKIYADASWFWMPDDPEIGYPDPWEVADNAPPGEPTELQRGGVVETRFYVSLLDDPETGEPWRRDFATEQEALDAIKQEQARRAALGDDA